jgi:hypothetical protein
MTMRIGVTGHQGLPVWVAGAVGDEMRARLAGLVGPVRGLTCLADGADQIFARAVLEAGGTIEVIVPAERYRDGLAEAARPGYDELFGRAESVHRLGYNQSTEQAHMAASTELLKLVDELWAVWDGLPARGYGGTADVVALAGEKGVPVTVIWPSGASRDG